MPISSWYRLLIAMAAWWWMHDDVWVWSSMEWWWHWHAPVIGPIALSLHHFQFPRHQHTHYIQIERVRLERWPDELFELTKLKILKVNDFLASLLTFITHILIIRFWMQNWHMCRDRYQCYQIWRSLRCVAMMRRWAALMIVRWFFSFLLISHHYHWLYEVLLLWCLTFSMPTHRFEMWKNEINELPDEIGLLTNLQTLVVRHHSHSIHNHFHSSLLSARCKWVVNAAIINWQSHQSHSAPRAHDWYLRWWNAHFILGCQQQAAKCAKWDRSID